MQEKLDALMRTQAMQLFRQQGLHFTMQQVAEPLHISKKTIYTVYPSKEALLLDMVDHAFAEIHRCKQEILAGGGTLQERLRAVIIAMPAEYAALDLRQMKELDEKYPVVAARVRSQLENGWEPTMALRGAGGGRRGHASGIPAGAAADDHRIHRKLSGRPQSGRKRGAVCGCAGRNDLDLLKECCRDETQFL